MKNNKKVSFRKPKSEKRFIKRKRINESEDDMQIVIDELAKFTNNDPSKAKVQTDYGYNHGVMISFPENNSTTFNQYGEEYVCYPNEHAAYTAAVEDVKELIDEMGGPLESGIHFEYIGGVEEFLNEDDARNFLEEDFYSVYNDMDEDELLEQFQTTDVDKIVKKELKSVEENYSNYSDYIIENLGNETLDYLIKNGAIDFDVDKLAEACVDTDGIAHSLAGYDGKEIALDCGWYCYRWN